MIPLPNPPKVIQQKGNKAIFEIRSLYPGYGITLGNSLRRVLLSSLEGAAITQVKIKGVSHEFSTIPGVLEDVIMILLNLKKLRFKLFSKEPQKAVLKVKGEKEVTGKDLKLPSEVEIVNPQSHIATLTKPSALLEMEVLIEKGVGYLPVEGREEKKPEVGVIFLDAIFTPVKKVNFKVENMRVGKRTDFDKLKLEIETDGTVTPQEAFKKACEILLSHFKFLARGEEAVEKEETGKEISDSGKEITKEKGKIKIEDLDLSLRTKNALLKGGIKTVGGLLRKKEEEWAKIEGLGKKGIEEIKENLKKLGVFK